MSLLPSMLIATTILGSGDMSADFNTIDYNTLQNQLNNDCITGQVITGTSSDLESILNELGVTMDSIKDCLPPSLPETNTPDTEKPDTQKPDTEQTPDTEKPDTEQTPEAAKSYVEQVVELVNAERTKAGLTALTMRDDLNSCALIRAKETVQSFSHTRPDGRSFSTVLTENGISYRSSGENIAWGQSTPEAVVTAWMNSEGHRANILSPNFTSIGVGYYLNGSTPYWTQLFTG